jgi:uncharacterized protein with PhoU and TrkA domain
MKFVLMSFVIIFSIFLGSCTENPEEVIKGYWQEEKWETNEKFMDELSQNNVHVIKRHRTEKWVFKPNNRFKIIKEDGNIIRGDWHILGRGHILKLIYDGSEETEIFNIKELNFSEMILNADIGTEIQGISKLYFKKI